MLDRLRSQDFTPLLRETFTLSLEPAAPAETASAPPTLGLKLVEVSGGDESGADDATEPRAPFSLVFHCSERAVLPQRIYSLAHPTFGELGLFLVPISADRNGVSYQAVFS